MNQCLVSALLDFKGAIENDPNDVLLDWDKSKSCKGGWTGVDCDSNSRVTKMYVNIFYVQLKITIEIAYYLKDSLVKINNDIVLPVVFGIWENLQQHKVVIVQFSHSLLFLA